MGMPSHRLAGVLVLASCAALAACGGSNFDVSSADATDETSADGTSADTSASDAPSDASPVDASDTSGIPGDVDTGTSPGDTGAVVVDAKLDALPCDWTKTCCAAPGAKPGACCRANVGGSCLDTKGWAYNCGAGDDFDRVAAKCAATPAEKDSFHTLWCCNG